MDGVVGVVGVVGVAMGAMGVIGAVRRGLGDEMGTWGDWEIGR